MAGKTKGKAEDGDAAAIDPTTGAAPAGSGTDGNPIEQVRDLLFGQEARAQRAEMAAMRADLVQQLERLDARLTERLDRLTDDLAKEVRTLRAALDDESKARSAEDASLRSALGETDAALADLDRRTSAADDAIRDALAREASSLREALEAAMSALSRQLDETRGDLDDRKADRVAVADLLRAAADGLAGPADSGGTGG